MTEDARLYGLPDNAAALFRPALHDIEKYPRIGINLACAHMQVANFSSAGKLLCEVMKNPDNGIKLEAAMTMMDMTVNRKAPTQPEHFHQATQIIDEACQRNNPKAWQVREQLAHCNFDIRFG
jgi:hypothetical protein